VGTFTVIGGVLHRRSVTSAERYVGGALRRRSVTSIPRYVHATLLSGALRRCDLGQRNLC